MDYRKFLVDKKVDLSKVAKSKLLPAVSYILDEIKLFLSLTEKCDIYRDQKYLSGQLGILRTNILKTLKKFCEDNKMEYPSNLFNMLEREGNE